MISHEDEVVRVLLSIWTGHEYGRAGRGVRGGLRGAAAASATAKVAEVAVLVLLVLRLVVVLVGSRRRGNIAI